MPIYDYECSSCGHEMEAIQKISDSPLTECPSCNEATLAKCVTAPSFRLGGSGWYETDFKTGKKKNISKSDSDGGKKKAETKKHTSTCCSTGTCK